MIVSAVNKACDVRRMAVNAFVKHMFVLSWMAHSHSSDNPYANDVIICVYKARANVYADLNMSQIRFITQIIVPFVTFYSFLYSRFGLGFRAWWSENTAACIGF
jgi:hypothetical protein